MLVALILAAAAATAPTPPSAQPATPPTTTAPAAVIAPVKVVADKEDPVICQSIESTGTNFTEKQCMHKSQWDQEARDGKDEYDQWSAGGARTH